MPKVISRAAISSSNDAPATASQQAELKTYFCLCGEFLLVIDKALELLPRRPLDESIVLHTKPTANHPARVFKLSSVPGAKVFVTRGDDLIEPRHMLLCPRCATPIGYQSEKGDVKAGPFVYLFWGGMTESQGTIPLSAWEGEEEVRALVEGAASGDGGQAEVSASS